MSSSSTNFPAKDQALVLSAIDDVKLMDYVVAIGKIVTPKNVLFASRISKNRICIYLDSKALVDDVVSKYSVNINGTYVNVRRLLNPARRIILSNVCPSIPHLVFENQIKALGFTIVSPMSLLKAVIQSGEYAHVLSFRRHIYVQPDDKLNLPDSLVLKYENTNYRVFFTFNDICFKCKMTGHFANECPSTSTTDASKTPIVKPTVNLKEVAGKRQNLDSDSSPKIVPLDLTGNSDRKSRKVKPSDSCESLTSTSELLLPVKHMLNNTEQYPLNYEQITEFMDKASGEKDILGLIRKYTDDIEGVLLLMYDVYPIVEHKSIKNRCRKVQRKIKKAWESDKNLSEDNTIDGNETYGNHEMTIDPSLLNNEPASSKS